jgi:putative membrane protein
MKKNPYERFESNQLILRDELAIDRTILANERTMISYLRGAITLVISGITVIHFVHEGILLYVGISIIPIGVIVGFFGSFRYRRMDKRLRAIRKELKIN